MLSKTMIDIKLTKNTDVITGPKNLEYQKKLSNKGHNKRDRMKRNVKDKSQKTWNLQDNYR